MTELNLPTPVRLSLRRWECLTGLLLWYSHRCLQLRQISLVVLVREALLSAILVARVLVIAAA